jgi:ubiquinone/menaquinone biosynthesis C-methylase UbiE
LTVTDNQPSKEKNMSIVSKLMNQCKKPTGWLGRFNLWTMNSRHSKLTDWGLTHISISKHDTILDVGCGGGRTVYKLAAGATEGKVYGIDHSEESVAVAQRTNKQWIKMGRVAIQSGSVSHLPFSDDMFDLVTAVETHYYWPDLPADMREILRVLKPGGTLIVIAEAYKGGKYDKVVRKLSELTNMAILSVDEHREFFSKAGYSDVQIVERLKKGWICGIGRKPNSPKATA